MLAAWPPVAATQQAVGEAPVSPGPVPPSTVPSAPGPPTPGSPAPVSPSPEKSALDYFKSGTAHLDKGNLDQAIADYTESIRLKPNIFVAYLNRGTAFRRKGEFDLAIADYNKAIELKADYYDAYTLRGICYGKKGRYEEAVADFTKALEKKPHYLNYLGLAWIYATSKNDKHRNGARAVELAQKAVLLHKTADSLHTLAAANAETGKFKEAVETQEEALDLLKKQGSPPKEDLARYGRQLQAYQGNKPWRE